MEDASAVVGFHLDGVINRRAVVDLKDVAFAAETSEEPADGFEGEVDHAAEIFVGNCHKEGDGEISRHYEAHETLLRDGFPPTNSSRRCEGT